MNFTALKNLSAKLGRAIIGQSNKRVPNADRSVSDGLLQPPTREDIRQCYRLILGREPENEQTIDEQTQYPNVAAFRCAALKSIEFRGKYRAICAEKPDPYWSDARPALAFIHLEKTGGTSLRDSLAAQFEEDRVCPGPNHPLYSFSVSELGYYDFFAGHFDLDSIRYIPRRNIKTVSLFREPRSRLISWYRFHKSHPPHGEHASNRLVMLANELTAEEFFESPEVRGNPLTYNRYLFAFGRSVSWFNHRRDSLVKSDLDAVLRDAKSSVSSLTTLGITEQFSRSVGHICKTLDLPPPATIKSANVTDEIPNLLTGFRRVEPVQVTPRLLAALEELISYDQEIYRFALTEFERRCAESEAVETGVPSYHLRT